MTCVMFTNITQINVSSREYSICGVYSTESVTSACLVLCSAEYRSRRGVVGNILHRLPRSRLRAEIFQYETAFPFTNHCV